MMHNCPECGNPCEWTDNAFRCHYCNILFFGIDCKNRFYEYVKETLYKGNQIKKEMHVFLYDLEDEHLNRKDKMTWDREEIYNAFDTYDKLENSIELAMKEGSTATYPKEKNLLQTLYLFDHQIIEIERIAKTLKE